MKYRYKTIVYISDEIVVAIIYIIGYNIEHGGIMDIQKRDFMNEMLSFVNQDIIGLKDNQCRRLAKAMQKKALIPYDTIIPIRQYSGGVMLQHFDVGDSSKCRAFLENLHFRLNRLMTEFFQGSDTEDFGDQRINFTLSMSGKFRLAVTPTISGPDSDVYMLLVGFAWALHNLPTDRIKKCQWCGHIFLQTTGKEKRCCSKQCADRVVDARRQGTPERKKVSSLATDRQYQKKHPGYVPVRVEGRKNRAWKKEKAA